MNQLNRPKRSRTLFYSLLAILLGLCFVRYALQVNIPPIVLTVVAMLIVLLGDRDETIALWLCCIPLYTSLDYGYVLLLSIVCYLAKFSRTVRFNLTIVPALLMFVWELLHSFDGAFSPVVFLGNNLPILLLTLLMCTDDNQFDYDFIVRAFAVTTGAMCLCLLGRLAFVANFNLAVMMSGMRRLGLDADTGRNLSIAGGQLNPNTLGILCVLNITGLMQLRHCGRGKTGDIWLILLLLIFGALSASKTYLACLVIMGILLVFSKKGTAGEKMRFIAGVLLAVLIVLALLWLLFPELMEFYYSRFLVADITTGRLDLMQVYNDYITSNPRIMFFGVGLDRFDEKLLTVYQVSIHVPHNGLQEVIVAWGVPGLLMFVLMWAAMILRGKHFVKNQSLIHFIPLLVLLAKAQAGQMLVSVYTMLAFSYAYLSLCADLTPGEEKRLFGRIRRTDRGGGHGGETRPAS